MHKAMWRHLPIVVAFARSLDERRWVTHAHFAGRSCRNSRRMFELSHPYTIGLETAEVIAMTWQAARPTYSPLGDVGAVGVTSKSTNTEKRPAKILHLYVTSKKAMSCWFDGKWTLAVFRTMCSLVFCVCAQFGTHWRDFNSNIVVFWEVTTCTLGEIRRRLGGKHWLHLQ